MDMDERQAMSEVVATQPGDKGQSVAASDELDFASDVRQQLTEVRQQMRQQNSDVSQQLTEVRQQMSQQNSDVSQQLTEVKQQILKMVQQNSEVTQQVSLLSQMFHSALSALMLQPEEHQRMKSIEQHPYSVSATEDMQQAKTTERHALMDDSCQSVQVVGAAAGIGAQRPADDRTEQDAAMPHQMFTVQSAVEQTRIADNLLLERLEQLANIKRIQHMTLHEFSESTTFHGLKYIIQGNVTARRRVLWFVAWLTALVLLVYLVQQKLVYLHEHPSSVNM